MRVNITSKAQILLTPVVVMGALAGALFVSIAFTSNANAARNAAEQFVENGSYGPCHEEYFSGPNFGNGFYDCGDGELDTYDQNIGTLWAVANGGSKYGGDWFPSAADVLQGQDTDIRVRIYSSAYGGGSGAISITNGSIDIDDVCSDNIDIDDDDETILRGNKGTGKGWTTGANNSYASATVSIDSDDTADVGLHYVSACITGTFWSEENGAEEQNDREFPIFFNVLPSWTMKAGVSVNKTTAAPGDTVTWTHTVENTEKGKTTDTGNYVVYRYQNVNSAGNATWDDGTRQDNAGLLRARASRNYCIDIDGGDTDDGSKIQLYGCNNTGAQTWVIEPSQNGRIRNTNSNKCLDVDNGSTKNGTKVQLYGCKNVDAQRWVYDSATGFIYYRNKDSGKCLDINNGSFSNGTKLQIYDCAETNAQKWLMDNAARDFDTAYVGLNQPGSSGNEGINAFSSLQKRTFTSTYKITQDDVGKKVCRRTAVNAHSRSDGGWVYSSVACVNVPYNYSVTPETTAAQSDVNAGDSVKFEYRLTNNGPTKTDSMNYVAYAFILKAGENIDSVISGPRTISSADCAGRGVTPTSKYRACNQVTNTNGVVMGLSSSFPNLGQAYTIMDSDKTDPIIVGSAKWPAEPGDKICSYSVVTSKWKITNGTVDSGMRASTIKCIEVNKNPQLQIRGSDSRAGGTWGDTGGTANGGDISGISQAVDQRGSWSQYGLHSNTGTIYGVGSAGQTTHDDSALNTGYCRLMFANTSSDGLKHCPVFSGKFYEGSSLNYTINLPKEAKYTAAKINTLTSLASLPFKTVNSQRCYILDSLASGVYQAASDDMYICGSNLTNGKHITIVSNGTVRLSEGGVKTASTSFSKLSDVPVFTLIAKQIIVNDYSGSSKVNNGNSTFGTYITTGDKGFTTCDVTAPSQLQVNGTCSYQLMVNGAVVSKQTPMLLRTIGAGAGTVNITANGETHTDMTTAAEIFNYQPNMFLTPYALSAESGDADYKTVKQTTLPARF